MQLAYANNLFNIFFIKNVKFDLYYSFPLFELQAAENK